MCQLKSLIFWLCEALVTSAIITYFTLFSLTDITSLDSSGQSFGLWFFGLANYTSVVVVVNLRLFFVFVTNSFSFFFFTVSVCFGHYVVAVEMEHEYVFSHCVCLIHNVKFLVFLKP